MCECVEGGRGGGGGRDKGENTCSKVIDPYVAISGTSRHLVAHAYVKTSKTTFRPSLMPSGKVTDT